MIKCDQKGLPLSPDFEIFHDILHIPQLSVQPAPLSGDIVQLTPEVIDIGIKEGLQVLPDSPGALLLQEAPLGLQDFVLLLQEPHLPPNRNGASRSCLQPAAILDDFPRNKVQGVFPSLLRGCILHAAIVLC